MSLTKKDEMLQYKLEPIPFLEELVRKIKEGKKLLTMDIKRLLPFETNRIDFVNGVAAEAKEYFGSNQDEYGGCSDNASNTTTISLLSFIALQQLHD
ncbi:hypothetical protein QQP08_016828 [Theobroma cacao]|nr:hypothetical protein QQP08_016828 [Theobroma cacao]